MDLNKITKRDLRAMSISELEMLRMMINDIIRDKRNIFASMNKQQRERVELIAKQLVNEILDN